MIVELDGLRSIVTQRGHGPDTVVLLASMLIRPRSYSRLVQRLSQSCRVITIEPPGCGRASKIDPPWRFEQYADHLCRLLDKLDLTDVTLIGHSNSAAVTMLAAGGGHAASARIGRIVLADSVGGDPRHSFWRIGLGRLLDGPYEAAFSITALYDITWNLLVHNSNFLAEIEQAIAWDAAPHAPRVRVPTLIAWGGMDFTFRPWCGRRLQRIIPNSQFYVSDVGSHDWLTTLPDEFATVVERFIAGRGSYHLPPAEGSIKGT